MLGVNRNDPILKTTYHILIDEVDHVEDCVIEISDNLFLIPANQELSGAELELIGLKKNWYFLKRKLDRVKESYDFIIIDCISPSNTLLILLGWRIFLG